METDNYCQSCGMPLQSPEFFGTDQDGSPNHEYCCYCYKKGTFTSECTMDEMINHCVEFLDEFNNENDTELTKEQAIEEMGKFFPKLKRWAVSNT